ncbi:MAG: dynamin family protein [Arcobacter sp.]|nr:dynamin family protein [Arcobacter sp.]
MSLANDYFLLYHGLTFEQNLPTEQIDAQIDEDTFCIYALILSTHRNEYEKFLTLEHFQKLFKRINTPFPKNLEELNHIQHNIIESIVQNNKEIYIQTMHETFDYLKDEEIISNDNHSKLISLFDHKDMKSRKLKYQDEDEDEICDESKTPFKQLKVQIEDILKELEELFPNEKTKTSLKDINSYINNQTFSIGITGVMNAGKSTMLNALMGKEILGSAVVPETANLSIVKYSKMQNAKVFYWDKKEWEKIENSAKQLESMKDFVSETKKVFKDDLEKYIQNKTRVDEIDINDLAYYTSADKSEKKCNLVKYVQLGSNLDFLKDGIEIVDTPGLDDPVIQREEITKEYLAKCDMMLHLMNVSQSATLKDVEFIIDALLYQNISKLLIVITRADTVSKEQLEEVINYTKTSIQKQLKAQNKDSKLDFILEHIKFIPISGKMALLHRTGREKEALDAGFSLEDTGILEIEDYLNETLFGANSQKGELIIQSAKQQLLRTLDIQKESLNYELQLLSKSKEELELELENFNKNKEKQEKLFFAIKEDINYYKSDSKNYISSLETFLKTELIDLQNVIRQRIISDVRYTYEKTKKRPPQDRTKVIVQTAIKDGIIDVIRDYRYKFIKKSQNISEQCEQKYHDFGFSINKENDNFDVREFFKQDFKSGFLTSNNEVLVSQIVNSISKEKPSNLDEINRQIKSSIQEQFKGIEETIKTKAREVSNLLIDNFFEKLNEPLKNFEQSLKENEKTLKHQISSFEQNEENKAQLSIQIHQQLKKAQEYFKTIKGLH